MDILWWMMYSSCRGLDRETPYLVFRISYLGIPRRSSAERAIISHSESASRRFSQIESVGSVMLHNQESNESI